MEREGTWKIGTDVYQEYYGQFIRARYGQNEVKVEAPSQDRRLLLM
jgi:hypothetical protein